MLFHFEYHKCVRMADLAHLAVFNAGVDEWNRWREVYPSLSPDLQRSNFSTKRLSGINFRNTNLYETKLDTCDLSNANLRGANLSQAQLGRADLTGAILVRTNLDGANLTGCYVYGTSVWDVRLHNAIQSDLIITREDEPPIVLDSLEVAQFVHLLLNNERIRQVIDTITSKLVLILGRFSPERKATLDALRQELRKWQYLPVLFDFEKPANRDLTETISTLAHMARFVIADITDARSIPQELMKIVPSLPSVPVQPVILALHSEYGMFEHFRRFPWVLKPFLYNSQDHLLASLRSEVIGPAEAKAKQQRA